MKDKLKGIIFFSLVFLVIDQVIKIIVSSKMVVGQSITITKNFFSITLTHNNGAAFNMLSGNRIFLVFIGIAILAALILYVNKLEVIDDFDIFIYSLLFGGIVGNLVDRAFLGYVVDYLSFNFGGYYFPIFNFADTCIVVSVILIIIRALRDDLWK